jgi:anti-sigma B factor antagonist
MSFSYSINDNSGTHTLIKLSGSLMERYESKDLLDEIDESIANGSVNLVINLEDLSYLSSSGLSVLLSLLTKCRKNDGDMVLLHLNPKLKQLLVITRLDQIIPIAENLEQALAMLNSQKQNP